jgi:hypothetical protein
MISLHLKWPVGLDAWRLYLHKQAEAELTDVYSHLTTCALYCSVSVTGITFLAWKLTAQLPFPDLARYPHDEYTVGFSGAEIRPYVNKVDNSINHAGEPCFSRSSVRVSNLDMGGSPNESYFIEPIEVHR